MMLNKFLNSKIPHLRLLTAAYCILLVCLSILASLNMDRDVVRALKIVPDSDKIMHFFLIGTLAFLVNQTLGNRTAKLFSIDLMVGSLIVSGIFTIEEFSQLFLAHRSFSPADMFANYCGIFLFGKLSLLKQHFESIKTEIS